MSPKGDTPVPRGGKGKVPGKPTKWIPPVRDPIRRGVPPWIIVKPPKQKKDPPAPQVDFGTFPGAQRSSFPSGGAEPVVWVWRSPDAPEVEAWVLLKPGQTGGFEVIGPASPAIDLYLSWWGVLSFRPAKRGESLPPYTDPPRGNPTNLPDLDEFRNWIVREWNVAASDLTTYRFDWSAPGSAGPGSLGLFEPGVYRVRQGQGMAPGAWVLHQPNFSREIWKLLDPPNTYVPPGASLQDAELWIENVSVLLPVGRPNWEAWFDSWVRTNEGVGASGVLVTHDVSITQVP